MNLSLHVFTIFFYEFRKTPIYLGILFSDRRWPHVKERRRPRRRFRFSLDLR